MKTLSAKLFLTILFLLFKAGVFAQGFTPAVLSQNTHGTSVSGLVTTGNDMWVDGKGKPLGASTFDSPANSGTLLAWDFDPLGTNTNGDISLGVAAQNSDVALVTDGTTIYAIVVYYLSSTTDCYMQIFSWSGTAFVSTGSPATIYTGATGLETLHISSNPISYFIITLSHGGFTYAFTGTPNGSGFPTINTGPLYLGRTYWSDNALMYETSTARSYALVATGDNAGGVNVDEYDFATLNGGTVTSLSTTAMLRPNSGYLHYPRVAYHGISTHDYWTVVCEEEIGSRMYIDGYENNSGNTFTFNNASWISPDLSTVWNQHPVVTYSANEIFIAWTFANPYGTISGAIAARYCITIKCKLDLTVISKTYLEVPTAVTTGDDYNSISLSGRDAGGHIYLTYWDQLNTTGYTKTVPNSPYSNLKLSSLDDNSFEEMYKANPDVNVIFYDITGRLVMENKGAFLDIIRGFDNNINGLPSSIYILKIISDDKKYNVSQKFVIN